MKKIAAIIAFSLTAATGFSQLATIAKQDAQMVKQDTANARLLSIQNSQYNGPTKTTQAASNATLIAIKKGIDTLNQTGRLQSTAAAQTINTATLALVKKGIDTLNQTGRLQSTAALQTINNATLTLVKKGIDTLNQTGRLQSTAALQTINNATLTLVKKGIDTVLTNQRKLKLVVDSINQVDKYKTVTIAITSTNAGTTYQPGYVIAGSTSAYTISVGTGNWEIVSAAMYLSDATGTTADVNLSVFTNTATIVNDNVQFASSTTFNSRYAGTLHFAAFNSWTGSPLFGARANTGSGVGDASVYVTSATSNTIWVVAWANTAFTPPASQVYTFKLFLRKVK